MSAENTLLNSDIYDITQTVSELQQKYISEESAETLAVGMYGYLNSIHSLILQNSIIMASELGNELFPSKAKFEKNVIAHSIIQNITDINATPAVLYVLIGLKLSDLENYFVDDKFTLDQDCTFTVEDKEFHLPYDLIIKRNYISNGDIVYSGMYDMSRNNPLSDIVNPYVETPFLQEDNFVKILYVPATLMQVSHTTVYNKLLSSSVIENKTYEFEFENQLADFVVKVTENGNTTYLTPVFEGMAIEDNLEDFCYYTYVDASTIRVRFDSISYMPGLNAEIETIIKTTLGAEGNFEYAGNYVTNIIKSTRFNYNTLSVYVRFRSDSEDGIDRKSVDELRRLLPKEALSRGSITNVQDLQNYFNMINSELDIMMCQKRTDNQFERSYYAYLLMKDELGNVIPTNTLDMTIEKSDFDVNDNKSLVIKPGSCILYNGSLSKLVDPESEEIQEILSTEGDKTTFLYTIPLMMIVNADPLYVSYYLTTFEHDAMLEFTKINVDAPIQFVSTYINWARSYNYDKDTYKLNLTLTQNINKDKGVVEMDDAGNVISKNIRVAAVFYNDMDASVPYRYIYGEMVDYIQSDFSYEFEFKLQTTDEFDDDAKIKVLDMNIPYMSPDEEGNLPSDYGYLSENTKVELYVLYKDGSSTDTSGFPIMSIDPTLSDEGWICTNMYTVNGGLFFYKNYTDTVTSMVKYVAIRNSGVTTYGFNIKSIPVIRYSYMQDESRVAYFTKQLDYRKAYIDNAVNLLENNFVVDFKLFNTYGPSTIYSTDKYGNNIIDRTNLSLKFAMQLTSTADAATKDYIIKDLKDIIEDLNEMDSLHIPNVITTITNNYRNSLVYFEFLGINDYGPTVQHLYHNDPEEVSAVPEFLTIHTLIEDNTPDITIEMR